MADRYDQEMILDYVEGDLSPAARVRFEAMLANDPPLRELTQKLVADRAALRGMPDEQPPAELIEDAMQQLERGMLLGDTDPGLLAGSTPHPRRLWVGRAAAYAGLAAVLVLTSGLLLSTLTGVDLLDTAEQYASVGRWFEKDGASPSAMENERLALLRERQSAESWRAAKDASGTSDTSETSSVPDVTGAVAGSIPPEPVAAAVPTEAPAAPATAPAGEAMAMMRMGIEGDAAGSDEGVDQSQARAMALSDIDGAAAILPFRAAVNRASHVEPAAMRIEVRTSDSGQTRRDVLAWAGRNHAVVVTPAQAPSKGQRSAAAVDGSEANAAAAPVLVQLADDQQVSQLVAYLNRDGAQQASVASPAQEARELDAVAVGANEPEAAADEDEQVSLFQRLIDEREQALRRQEQSSAEVDAEPSSSLPAWFDPLNLKVLPSQPMMTPSHVVLAEVYITEARTGTETEPVDVPADPAPAAAPSPVP